MISFPRFPRAVRVSLVLLGLALAGKSPAALPVAAGDITGFSLEDLMNLEITSVSRKAERYAKTAAAVFVITAEDIRRSGATTIPDVLRMAPGVEVARISNSGWAVSARGFNGRFANKLLVMVDGRSIYSQLFSGVVWEAEDINLEDIDRIEVIRGPVAALWGANAVNGVISIITKKARDTQGAMVSASVGDEDRGGLTVRHGGSSDDTQYRIYAKARSRDRSVDLNAPGANDTWRSALAGFRMDRRLTATERLTLSGEARSARAGDVWIVPQYTAPYSSRNEITEELSRAHVLGRYERSAEDGSTLSFQAYFDHSENGLARFLNERRDTIDLQFQHGLRLGERHDIVWGLSYRASRDDLTGEGFVTFAPRNRTFTLGSVFLHDDITLVPDRLRLTLGAMLEYNNFARFEPQPTARVLWTPDATHSFWGAASRATRTPSRGEQDSTTYLNVQPPFSAQNPTPFPLLALSVPNARGRLDAERVDALEAGYRARLGPRLSLDAALFSNRYSRLRAVSTGAAGLQFLPLPVLVAQTPVDNSASANTRGIELALDWRPYAWWRVQPSYTRFSMAVPVTGDLARDRTTALLSGTSPANQFSLRSQFDITARQQFDLWLRHVDGLDWGGIPSRWELDLRYAWRPRKDLELALVGQNLLHGQRTQFLTDFLASTQWRIQRSVHLNAKWQF